MQSAANAAVRFEDLTLGYEAHPAVHHLRGTIQPGTLLAIVGPNGAGKSTLLKAICGALRPLSGQIVLDGVRRNRIAYLPQQSEIDRSFPISVYDMVALGLWSRVGAFGTFGHDEHGRIKRALSAVGLEGFDKRSLDTLSGGQMQRVLFARLLLQDAPLILLDEPFSSIDSKTAADLMALVERWHGEKRTVVAVLHDMDQVRTHFPETMLLAREVIAWGPTTECLSAQNLLRARAMTEAWDEHAEECRRSA